MVEYLLYVVGAFALIQLLYYVLVFLRLALFSADRAVQESTPAVSVLVCAWNERANLAELLPMLDQQDYPEFEVIVLDDRSHDGTEDFIREHIADWKHIRYVRINDEFEHVTPKKYALTIGMKHANNPIALMTDADCRPTSTDWIRSMSAEISDQKDIVIGFSPYQKEKGILNWFIRCETFYSAVQYLSFSLMGITYMGVGRNIMYKRSVFFKNKGFYRHHHVTGGDDDIFLNEVSTSDNTAICIEPASWMESEPKHTWYEWFRQKKRHLSVSKYYRTRNKVLLGILSTSHIGFWLSSFALLLTGIIGHHQQILIALGVIWAIRWVIQWIILAVINNKLGNTVEWFSFLLMDFALFIYYLFFGIFVMSKKKSRTTWN